MTKRGAFKIKTLSNSCRESLKQGGLSLHLFYNLFRFSWTTQSKTLKLIQVLYLEKIPYVLLNSNHLFSALHCYIMPSFCIIHHPQWRGCFWHGQVQKLQLWDNINRHKPHSQSLPQRASSLRKRLQNRETSREQRQVRDNYLQQRSWGSNSFIRKPRTFSHPAHSIAQHTSNLAADRNLGFPWSQWQTSHWLQWEEDFMPDLVLPIPLL